MSQALSTIPGVKKTGANIIAHAVPEDRHMRVFITNVELSAGKSEPALFVGRRQFGYGKSVVIPLSVAWTYNEPEMLTSKLWAAANQLFGRPSRAEAHLVADVILRHLPELFTHAPEKMESHADWQNRMAAVGLKVEDSEGNVLIDLTEKSSGRIQH